MKILPSSAWRPGRSSVPGSGLWRPHKARQAQWAGEQCPGHTQVSEDTGQARTAQGKAGDERRWGWDMHETDSGLTGSDCCLEPQNFTQTARERVGGGGGGG